MKEQPGPVFGWPPLYTQLARDLRVCLPPGAPWSWRTSIRRRPTAPRSPWSAGTCCRGSPGAGPCVLVSHRWPQAAALDQCPRRSASELRLSASAVRRDARAVGPGTDRRARNRAMWLVGGRAALLAGLRELAGTAGRGLEPLLERVAEQATSSWRERRRSC